MNRVRAQLSATRALRVIEDEGAQQQQCQAIEDDQAFQDAEVGTNTSEQVEYAHHWKRETATQGGLARMAHKPDRLFEEGGDGQGRQRPEQEHMGDLGADCGNARQEPNEPETDVGSDRLEARAHKPANVFGDSKEGEEPDGGTENIAAAQTESAQEAPDRRKHMEQVIEHTTAKPGERMQTQLREMVRQSFQETQTSLEALVTTTQEAGGHKHTRRPGTLRRRTSTRR